MTISKKMQRPVSKFSGLEDNYTNLSTEVIKEAVKEEGSNYLTAEGGLFWLELLGIDSNILPNLKDTSMDDQWESVKINVPKACGNCGSASLEYVTEDYEGMRDTFWACSCGWEDAGATFSIRESDETLTASAA